MKSSVPFVFLINFRVSVDVGYHLKRLDINDKQKVTIQLWDIPGKFVIHGVTKSHK